MKRNTLWAAAAASSLIVGGIAISASPVGAAEQSLSIKPAVSVKEGTNPAGTKAKYSNAYFAVTLAQKSMTDVTFRVHTEDGAATAPSDYRAKPSTQYMIKAGKKTAVVTVQVVRDATPESDETFQVVIDTASVAIGNSTGTGTITDDDTPSGGGTGQTTYVGNDLIPRTGSGERAYEGGPVDGVDGANPYLLIESTSPFTSAGSITTFRAYAARDTTDSLYFVVTDSNYQVKYVSQSVNTTADSQVTLTPDAPVAVQPGDLLGFGFTNGGTVPYTNDDAGKSISYNISGRPQVGDEAPRSGYFGRTYSFGALVHST